MKPCPGKVLVMHQGALGDFLLALSVLEGFSRSCTDMRMDFWSRREHLALIASKPYFGRGHASDGPELAPFYHEELWRSAPLPPFFRDIDTVLLFGQSSARLLASRLSRRLAHPILWLRSFPESELPRPVTRFLVEQLRHVGWEVEAVSPCLDPAAEDLCAAGAWLEQRGVHGGFGPVVVHPGSGGLRKVWPLQRWWALLHWLHRDLRCPVLLSLGPADAMLKDFSESVRSFGIHVLEGLSLPRLSAFLRRSRLFVGSDSGVSHLAAAVGTPAIVIFGPTEPRVWAPQGPHVHVVQSRWEESEVMAWLPQAETVCLEAHVREKVEALVRCTRELSTGRESLSKSYGPVASGDG